VLTAILPLVPVRGVGVKGVGVGCQHDALSIITLPGPLRALRGACFTKRQFLFGYDLSCRSPILLIF